MTSNSLRRPNVAYKGKNAFLDTSSQDVELPESATVPLQETALDSGAMLKRQRPLREAVDIHRSVEDMLQIKGSYFPGLDAMKEANTKSVSSDEVTSRLKELEIRHQEEIQKLHDLCARDYISRVMDAYQSTDDAINLPELERFIGWQVSSGTLTADMISEYHNYRYAYLRAKNELLIQLRALCEKEEKERKARDAQFPQSIAQYRSLDSVVQARVARFLVADPGTKERMLSQFGWVWRQVVPLMNDFKANDVFSAEIRSRVRAGDTDVRDPRRRVS